MLARKFRMAQGRGNRVCQNVTNRAQSRAQLPRSTIHSRRMLRTGLVQTSKVHLYDPAAPPPTSGSGKSGIRKTMTSDQRTIGPPPRYVVGLSQESPLENGLPASSR